MLLYVRTTPRDHQVRLMICKIIRVNQFRSNFIIYRVLKYIQYSQSATDRLRSSFQLQMNYDLPRAASLDRSVNPYSMNRLHVSRS